MSGKLLALDFSTSITGWATFDIKTKKLLDYGHLVASNKGLSKLFYPQKPLERIRRLVILINELINNLEDLQVIAIEEVCHHKARLTGKVLSGAHFLLLDKMSTESLYKVDYIDVSGSFGWRPVLSIRLTAKDKADNKLIKAQNKKRKAKKEKLLPVIGWKHLSCRYVNRNYGLKLNCDINKKDGDIADSICIGECWLKLNT